MVLTADVAHLSVFETPKRIFEELSLLQPGERQAIGKRMLDREEVAAEPAR